MTIPTWEAKNTENGAQTEPCATTTLQDRRDESAKKETAQKNTFFGAQRTPRVDQHFATKVVQSNIFPLKL